MSTPVIVSSSSMTLSEVDTNRTLPVPIESGAVGDVVLIWTTAITFYGDNVGDIVVPPGWAVLFIETGPYGWNILMTGRLTADVTESITIERVSSTAPGLIWWAQSIVIRDVIEDVTYWEDFDSIVAPPSTSTFSFNAMDVLGPDRLVLHYFPGQTNNEIVYGSSITSGFEIQNTSVTPLFSGSIFGVTAFIEASADTPAGTMSVEALAANTGGRTMSLVIKPRPPGLPAPAPSSRLRLGCAESYNVWITDASYTNTIGRVGWSKLDWSRVLDEISTAKVRLPDKLGGAYCCADFGGIEEWDFGLLIERDDQRVWSGPITSLQRDGDSLLIGASDNLARMTRRLAVRDDPAPYTSIDAGLLLRNVINIHAHLSTDPFHLVAPTAVSGAFADRTLLSRDLEMAWDFLEELLGSSVDAYMVMNTLYVWDINRGWMYDDEGVSRVLDGPYNAAFDMEYGMFTGEAFAVRPNWSSTGDFKANFVAAAAADSGELGFRRIKYAEDVPSQARAGVLDYADTNPIVRPGEEEIDLPDSVLQRRADTILALRRRPPVVITGGVLSEGAPIDVPNLRPGSIWRLDVEDACYTQLLQAGRLKRVDVDVSVDDDGMKESIKPTLQPIGWTGLGG